MKTTSNKSILSMTGLALLLAALVASPSMAIVNQMTTTKETKGSSATCAHITTLESTNQATIATRMAGMQGDFTKRLATITANKTDIDQKLAITRAAASAQFESKLKSLEAQTGLTQVQLQAISTYKTDIQQAEATREKAVDAARTTYRAALLAEVQIHQQDLSSAVTTYQTAVTAAFTTAVTNCGDGAATASLKTTVKSARETLTAARHSDKVTTSIKQLATTRAAAIKTANEAFAISVGTYTTTLTTALQTTN